MPKLCVNGHAVTVPEGAPLLEAVRLAGFEVPTLCALDGYPAFTSCMVCVVRESTSDSLLPSCSTLAEDGMSIETDTDIVRVARREALELLLSEHVGDCEAPCTRVCPAHLEIPAMLRLIAAGDWTAAAALARRDLVLPATLGRICAAPCEKGCRRAECDATVAIRRLHGTAAELIPPLDTARTEQLPPPTGQTVAIIGAGPAGLAAAAGLARRGHRVTIHEARNAAGGALRQHLCPERLPPEVLDAEIAAIVALGVDLRLDAELGRFLSLDQLRADCDALIVACGVIEPATHTWLELERTEYGLRTHAGTRQTSAKGVFAVGSAVRPMSMAVSAVAAGTSVAAAVDRYLTGGAPVGRPRFGSIMGKLREGECAVFLDDKAGAMTAASALPPEPATLTPEVASREARRCLECDCRAADHCALRDYADRYGARQRRYQSERPALRRKLRGTRIIYDPGKCIKCGRCVRICAARKEPVGLTFVNRGFAVEVAPPFNADIDSALTVAAEECVEACPTGALVWVSRTET